MSATNGKSCPFCAETIKLEAIFCRFCKRDLSSPENGVPPPPPSISPAPVEGDLVCRDCLSFSLAGAELCLHCEGYDLVPREFAPTELWEEARKIGRLVRRGDVEVEDGAELFTPRLTLFDRFGALVPLVLILVILYIFYPENPFSRY